ncbi:molecular chaperone [Stenotrophomonas maltophilia]|uniref:fimbrial biogenesis chaperone n=1 Tax=Stenotrophomonas maltophilia TaxID=40324 RepID=UPI001312B3E5
MKKYLWTVLLLAATPLARADLRVDASRLVLDESVGMASVRVGNRAEVPSLVQAWIDDGAGETELEALRQPLAVTTPLFKIAPRARRDIGLRLVDPAALPQDRESMFWLNILDLTARGAQERALDVAMHWRMKVFHRPTGLPGDPSAAAKALEWRIRGGKLEARNPTAYFVSLGELTLNGSAVPMEAASSSIAPFSTWATPVDGDGDEVREGTRPSVLDVLWLDDAGLPNRMQVSLEP